MIWLWLSCASGPDPLDGIMARLDVDGSGAIEADEASPLADFATADADGDGRVGREELRTYLDAFGAAARPAKGPSPVVEPKVPEPSAAE